MLEVPIPMSAPLEQQPRPATSERVVCEHAARCGGCPLIDLSYGEQLALKGQRIAGALGAYPWVRAPAVEPIAPANPVVSYRTRAKLIVGAGGTLGLYAKGGGHHVVDIPRCRVLAPSLERVAAVLRERIAASERVDGVLAPFDPAGRGCLRAVDLREVRDGDATRVLVTWVLERGRCGDAEGLRAAAADLMRRLPEVAGVAANFHDGSGPQILGAETVVLAGATSARDRIGASTHFATYGSFVQAHRGQAARVHDWIAEAVRPDVEGSPGQRPRVLDLYGGSGSIALGLAAAGASVHLIESFAPSVAQARAAASALGLDVHAESADVATALQALAESHVRFDAAVINPPRRGTSPAAREWLARLEPRVVVYVSCDPDTLARDLDHLGRLGYGATSLRPLDMIPLTDEVETVAVLRRGEVPQARVVYEDDQVLVVEKGPHEPTTPQGEYAGSLLARVRRIPGAEEAVPVHRLDVGTGGLVVFARRPEHVAAWASVLSAEATRKVYVAAVRGVAPTKGSIARALLEGRRLLPARTRYRRLAIVGGHSVLRIVPDHGRTHQIRRHFKAIGHPVLGDERYGDVATNRYFAEKHGLDRAFLQCVRLELDHPITKARLVLESPLAGDLRTVLTRAGAKENLKI